MNREAILRDDDPELRAKLAWYTATAMHEGLHLDQHAYLASKGLSADGEGLERAAYGQSTLTLALLDKKFGLTVAGSKYEEVALAGAYFAMTGNPYGLDMSGRSLLVVKGAEDIQALKNKYGVEVEKLLIQGEPYVGRGGLISKINESVFDTDGSKRPNGQDRLLELIYDPKRVYDFSDKKVKDYVETGNVRGDDFWTAVGNGIYGFFSGFFNIISIPFNFIKQPAPGVDGVVKEEDNPSTLYSWSIDYSKQGGPWGGMLSDKVELASIMIDPAIKSMETGIPPLPTFLTLENIEGIIDAVYNNWFGDELDKLVDNKENWRSAGVFLFDTVGMSFIEKIVKPKLKGMILPQKFYSSEFTKQFKDSFFSSYNESIKNEYVQWKVEDIERYIYFDYGRYQSWWNRSRKR